MPLIITLYPLCEISIYDFYTKCCRPLIYPYLLALLSGLLSIHSLLSDRIHFFFLKKKKKKDDEATNHRFPLRGSGRRRLGAPELPSVLG